jgi:hypothetical protein
MIKPQRTEDRRQRTDETTFNKKFLRGVQGGSFSKKRPPGHRRQKKEEIANDNRERYFSAGARGD